MTTMVLMLPEAAHAHGALTVRGYFQKLKKTIKNRLILVQKMLTSIPIRGL